MGEFRILRMSLLHGHRSGPTQRPSHHPIDHQTGGVVADLTGQVGLRQGATQWSVGWWIEKITHTKTHHTVLIVDAEWCISAEPGRVKRVRIDSYPSLVVTKIVYKDGEAARVAAAAAAMLGTRYNYAALLIIAADFLLHTHTPHWLAYWVSHNGSVDCSQLCDQAITEGTGRSPFPEEPGLVWPGLFEQYT